MTSTASRVRLSNRLVPRPSCDPVTAQASAVVLMQLFLHRAEQVGRPCAECGTLWPCSNAKSAYLLGEFALR